MNELQSFMLTSITNAKLCFLIFLILQYETKLYIKATVGQNNLKFKDMT